MQFYPIHGIFAFCYVHATLPCLSCKVLFSIGSDRKKLKVDFMLSTWDIAFLLCLRGFSLSSSSLSLLQSLEQINWLLLLFFFVYFVLVLVTELSVLF